MNSNLLRACAAAFLPLALLLPSPARAIVNVEQAIIGHGYDGWHSSLSVLGSGASGNTEKSANKADWLNVWQHGIHSEFLQLQSAYGKSRGQVDTDRAFAHLRHRSEVGAGWGVEGFAQVGQDRFARLSQRTLLGGGLRWVLFEEQQRAAGYLGLGAFHERETLSSLVGTTDSLHKELWRGNSYLILKQQFNALDMFISVEALYHYILQ